MNKLFWRQSSNENIEYAIRTDFKGSEHAFEIFTNKLYDSVYAPKIQGYNLFYNQESFGLFDTLAHAKEKAQDVANNLNHLQSARRH